MSERETTTRHEIFTSAEFNGRGFCPLCLCADADLVLFESVEPHLFSVFVLCRDCLIASSALRAGEKLENVVDAAALG
jgi:hypothetical protein